MAGTDMNNLVGQARAVALEALKDETRYDGTPFLSHPDNVAGIVRDEIGLPETCVAAVYLHEATRVHKDVDISAFPQDVRTLVDGLNKISTIKPKDTRLEAENYKKLIVQYSTDPRVTVLKIADRLEVMRCLQMFPKTSRDQKLLETLMLYMPLAHQLGLYNINNELGNIWFRYADPEQYRAITNKLKATEKDREQIMAEFIEPLKKKLSAAGIVYKLKIRTKSAYSIYRKMQVQKVPFEGVYDVFAIRFIIDCEDDPKVEKDLCWKVFSYVTEEYESDTKRLRDWLTTPRPNGYESLHITVKNRSGQALEVQIRTKRMDIEAESGNAAHWAYKGIRHEASIDRWLQSVRDVLEHPYDAAPEDLPAPPSREIFVFTPTGELRILPAGASVLDFAFNIHSGLGSRCTGGRVNGRAVPIREKLKMPNKDGLAMQVYGSVVPPAVSDAVTQLCHTIAQQIVDAFGLSHTPFFFQAIIEDDHVSVLELSPRIGGGLSYKLILDRTGVDVIDVAVESYFGDPTVREVRADAPSLASTIVYAKDGVFSHVTGIEEALAAGDIVSWDQMAEEGTEFGGYMDSRNRVGAFYSAGQGYGELCEKVERASQTIDVISKDGTSIKVKDLYLHL